MKTKRSFCIHAHFYQPPREDPITGSIPSEAGSHPYKNWNERIHSECYRPNALLGNYKNISFNMGPTLCDWMESHDPKSLELIIEQDRENVRRYGVGNAIAQAYNHTILPLASYQDKVTQIAWGIADFCHRFGRKPQGMWLPETAVDLETLTVLAEHDINFTILAPWQADAENLDSTRPYKVSLPDGKSITVFFYNAELSTRVSFDPTATSNADIFVQKILKPQFKAYSDRQPRLLLIASDGELYGHHQIFRDHFLAHLLNGASANEGIETTYLSRWLQMNPPQKSIFIREKTSWSCHHGVMRWMGACACTPSDGVWKAYLRKALDHLGKLLDQEYLGQTSTVIPDPWRLRNRYIEVVLRNITAKELIDEAAGRSLPDDDSLRIQLLLQAQFERQRMFTSCGWYFEDFSRIEPKNNIAYAAQAVRLTRLAGGKDLSADALQDLQHVFSYRTGLRGDILFRKQLKRAEDYASEVVSN
jgi:alpha-amylase/alpha-mannosidase (GH57 family)